MHIMSSRKNKIVLADYNFRADIENRLLLAQFSIFDVEVLSEVLNSSLTFSLSDLVDALEASYSDVVKTLDKLAPSRLLQHDGTTVRVDKERRKYYEFQIQKFDEAFAPDLEYVLRGLKRVPIQVLPSWYSIPRTSDDIFASIIEKYLHHPKVYQRYLQDMTFDDPIPLAILRDVYASEDFTVSAKTLRDKYKLSDEQFEEYLLLLEFNFGCYLSYAKANGMWKEVVTPMHEWREFLRFQRDTEPKKLSEGEIVRYHHGGDFAFVNDLTALVRLLEQQPFLLEDGKLPTKVCHLWKPALNDRSDGAMSDYLQSLLTRLLELNLAEVRNGHLSVTAQSIGWCRRSPQDQALMLYRLPLPFADRFAEKNSRSIEKGLKRVIRSGWVTAADFLRGLYEPLGEARPVTLRQKGKRWSYAIPTQSEQDKDFARKTLCGRLFHAGMVTIGSHLGFPCFCVTPFGRLSLGD